MSTIRISPTNKVASALFPTSIRERGKIFKLRAISTELKRGVGESLIGKLEGKQTITKLRKVLLVYETSSGSKTTNMARKQKTKKQPSKRTTKKTSTKKRKR